MQATAKLNHARISAQKCRLVVDQIRGLPVERALQVLNTIVNDPQNPYVNRARLAVGQLHAAGL